jgi:hypothetical protein
MACSYTAVWGCSGVSLTAHTTVWYAQLSVLMTSKDLLVQADFSAGLALLHCCTVQYTGDVRSGQWVRCTATVLRLVSGYHVKEGGGLHGTRVNVLSVAPTTEVRSSLCRVSQKSQVLNSIVCRSLVLNFIKIGHEVLKVRVQTLLRLLSVE